MKAGLEKEINTTLKLLKVLRDAHKLPNDNPSDYNLGYVEAMNQAIHSVDRIKEAYHKEQSGNVPELTDEMIVAKAMAMIPELNEDIFPKQFEESNIRRGLVISSMIWARDFEAPKEEKGTVNITVEEYDRLIERFFTEEHICDIQTSHYDEGYHAGVESGINSI